ncbi:hypothetical protein QWA68_015087 [Fusarium oxysporum]|nr:hypothetical protein QWA68_015087 [Fusarium oxysporum]
MLPLVLYTVIALTTVTLVHTVRARSVFSTGPQCIALGGENGPLQVTTGCVDPLYMMPIITNQTDETSPIPHRRISGFFNGTTTDFNIYLPPTAGWAGRFFQLVYPLQNSTAEDESIAFGADSGAYTVRVKGSLGYRADAAVAKLSRDLAREYYQKPNQKIYGYIYGGSGGSLQAAGALENTFGVWHGGLVLIQAVPISNPSNWCVRILGGTVLASKRSQIRDILGPGGSGNLPSVLNPVELAVLEEGTQFGIPRGSWVDFEAVGGNRTSLWDTMRTLVAAEVKVVDPTYADDFWTQPGYVGTEKSDLGDFFRHALINYNTTITKVATGLNNTPTKVVLDFVPSNATTHGFDFTVYSGNGNSELGSFQGYLDAAQRTVSIYTGANAEVLSAIQKGARLRVDNRWFLALHTFHRHQIPSTGNYYGLDFLRQSNGEPLYPQRKVLVGPSIARSPSGGGTNTGEIKAKVIVMDSLMDFDAFPWHADWYKLKVKNALRSRFDDNYRLYYNDHSNHFIFPGSEYNTIDFVPAWGSYEQLLRDLSAWTEQDIEPPSATRYSFERGQILIPASAPERLGIQPVVDLTVNGKQLVEVKVGEKVNFRAHIEVPPGTGSVVLTEWDLLGVGNYTEERLGEPGPAVDVALDHRYDAVGTYLAAIRVASQRQGNSTTPFCRVLNLGRVRVMVSH